MKFHIESSDIIELKTTENGWSAIVKGSALDDVQVERRIYWAEYVDRGIVKTHPVGLPWARIILSWRGEIATITCEDAWNKADDFCERFKVKMKEGFKEGITLDDKRMRELKQSIAEEMGINIR
jgi:hypothetical protein